MANYNDVIGTWTPEQWQAFGLGGGTIGSGNELVSAGTTPATDNPYQQFANSKGLGGISQGAWNNVGQATGLAGSVYNIYDGLFGNKADLYKQQIGMLKDQRASNAYQLDQKKAFNEVWNNTGQNKGLAASYGAPADNGIKSVVKL